MQTKNTAKVSNGDLGFIRYIKDGENGKRVGLDFGVGRELEYSVEDMVNLDLAYATTIHKSMGSEYETVIMPLLKAHSIMLYRNLLYTGITRADWTEAGAVHGDSPQRDQQAKYAAGRTHRHVL